MGTGLENMTEVVLKVGLRGVEGYLKERKREQLRERGKRDKE